MSKPVNLNRYRKQKARAAKKARADENAIVFGLSKAEKTLREAQHDKTERYLDGKKQE